MKPMETFRAGSDDKALDENPYMNAQRTLNDRSGGLIRSRHIWQAVALLSLIVTIGAVGGVVYLANHSRFIPYVVEVDKLGRTVGVDRADLADAVDERVVHAALASFVHDFRMISFDRSAQNNAIWRIYAMLQSGDPATNKITDYMRDPATSPIKRAEEISIGVEIISVLRQTEETWEVDWSEKVWDRQGVRIEQYQMRGLLTIYVVPPTSTTTEDEIRKNPLGIFVRDITWSRLIEQ